MTIKSTTINNLTLFVLFSIISISCSNQSKTEEKSQTVTNSIDSNKVQEQRIDDSIKAGAICTVEDGDGKFGIIKVLVMEPEIAHIKIYKNKFATRPSKIDLKTLSMGSINDKDGFGIGHTPLSRKGFEEWKPVVIANEKVSEEELEGYRIWKSQ